jgi:hypothetical protein
MMDQAFTKLLAVFQETTFFRKRNQTIWSIIEPCVRMKEAIEIASFKRIASEPERSKRTQNKEDFTCTTET